MEMLRLRAGKRSNQKKIGGAEKTKPQRCCGQTVAWPAKAMPLTLAFT
jgi:hypothetical protein